MRVFYYGTDNEIKITAFKKIIERYDYPFNEDAIKTYKKGEIKQNRKINFVQNEHFKQDNIIIYDCALFEERMDEFDTLLSLSPNYNAFFIFLDVNMISFVEWKDRENCFFIESTEQEFEKCLSPLLAMNFHKKSDKQTEVILKKKYYLQASENRILFLDFSKVNEILNNNVINYARYLKSLLDTKVSLNFILDNEMSMNDVKDFLDKIGGNRKIFEFKIEPNSALSELITKEKDNLVYYFDQVIEKEKKGLEIISCSFNDISKIDMEKSYFDSIVFCMDHLEDNKEGIEQFFKDFYLFLKNSDVKLYYLLNPNEDKREVLEFQKRIAGMGNIQHNVEIIERPETENIQYYSDFNDKEINLFKKAYEKLDNTIFVVAKSYENIVQDVDQIINL